ncbi:MULTISPECIES: methionine ABC transporter permease [Petrotoga]|uniref:D-methionine transport system permease protein n=2 Tax=Petrotoga sibirica TaxID=156202 RepID=A0A4R8ERN3_9BACT|nr:MULTISPECIES: methionine ABC transporter permease [Petrotoga]KUK82467.1 MAG: Binding-protein-dependent transport systems inner membrane component [Petrotoga mobilis]POZ88524.1 methionine ABC transporter permease [Petrotoga sibirica DSM 13575]POZ90661.1 methionine ABC transporter permease [Petrotoga sp. SL27]TDX14876.1 D-methionine transport system permease protein [Petrotoga sibirica]
MIQDLFIATLETLYMTFVSGFIAVLLGIPLGIALYMLSKSDKKAAKTWYSVLDWIVNIFRSIPFIILIILIIPLTRLLTGTIIGSTAAIVPLSIAAIPFMARLAETSFNNLSQGLLDTSVSMGMTNRQFIFKVLLPETAPEMVSNITLLVINLITYTAIAGAVGAGGLGAMAINYGYQRFRMDVLLYDVAILIFLTQITQFVGSRLSNSLRK